MKLFSNATVGRGVPIRIRYRAHFKYMGATDDLFVKGHVYYLTVVKGFFGRTKIDCRRPRLGQQYHIAKKIYKNFDAFEADWLFRHGFSKLDS